MKTKLRIYKNWLIERQFPSGYWLATNYGDGYSPLRADTLAGLKRFITETIHKKEYTHENYQNKSL
jgi:hypothetical protein